LITYDWQGRPPLLLRSQEELLSSWIASDFPSNTTPIIAYILTNFGVEYSHSGCLSLLYRLEFTYIRPKRVPKIADETRQKAFIAHYEALLNRQNVDEVVVFVDAAHPEHQSRPAFGWAKLGEKVALKSSSGRQRLNIHGAIALETGQFTANMPETVNAQSSFALFEKLEAAYPQKCAIHVFLDNAAYHHAKMLQIWLKRPDCRIKLHFLPPYCPHLNPIERLWGVMHKNVTHNKSYQKFKDFRDAVDTFFSLKLPQNWNVWREAISDNFRVIKLDQFRVLN
jgi:transposase